MKTNKKSAILHTLMLTTGLVAIMGYPSNLNTFIWSWTRPSLANFLYSMAFLFAWLLLLFSARRKIAKRLLVLYLVYWSLSIVFAAIPSLAVTLIAPPFIFWVPVIGVGYPFVGLSSTLPINAVNITSFAILLCSILMLVIGVCASYKFFKV